MNNQTVTKKTVRISLFVAIALIMFLLESLIPPIFAFAPGAKLGLANVVSLCALILLGIIDAFLVVIIRCLLASFFTGNVVALMYSLPSSLAALTTMTILYVFVFDKISLMCISFVSALVFNFVQLCIASVVVANAHVLFMFPLMFLASAGAGIFVGLVSYYFVRHLPSSVYR
ncbi:MAG: Gx transporter family protein [Clostridiales bacterium]|jgi:heptaprenyl diphosphate synthase|nr:Gx transporter family protein [Clostridiales bacterium]